MPKYERVKNANWREANQLAIYKHGRGFELGTTMNKSSKRSGRDLNQGPLNYKSNALTTRPLCLLKVLLSGKYVNEVVQI